MSCILSWHCEGTFSLFINSLLFSSPMRLVFWRLIPAVPLSWQSDASCGMWWSLMLLKQLCVDRRETPRVMLSHYAAQNKAAAPHGDLGDSVRWNMFQKPVILTERESEKRERESDVDREKQGKWVQQRVVRHVLLESLRSELCPRLSGCKSGKKSNDITPKRECSAPLFPAHTAASLFILCTFSLYIPSLSLQTQKRDRDDFCLPATPLKIERHNMKTSMQCLSTN